MNVNMLGFGLERIFLWQKSYFHQKPGLSSDLFRIRKQYNPIAILNVLYKLILLQYSLFNSIFGGKHELFWQS